MRVIVGGAPVTPEFAAQVGADGYAPDAASAVPIARQLVAESRELRTQAGAAAAKAS